STRCRRWCRRNSSATSRRCGCRDGGTTASFPACSLQFYLRSFSPGELCRRHRSVHATPEIHRVQFFTTTSLQIDEQLCAICRMSGEHEVDQDGALTGAAA